MSANTKTKSKKQRKDRNRLVELGLKRFLDNEDDEKQQKEKQNND